MESSQSQRSIILEFGGETFLNNVITTLRVEVIQGIEVPLGQSGSRWGHEGNPEQTPKLVRPWPRRYLYAKETSSSFSSGRKPTGGVMIHSDSCRNLYAKQTTNSYSSRQKPTGGIRFRCGRPLLVELCSKTY